MLAQMSFRLHPERVIVDSRVKDDPLTRQILSRLPGSIAMSETGERGDPLSANRANGTSDAVERFSAGKQLLMITRYDGEWLKPCPGTDGHVCCNLWIVNPGEGCPMDCTYCYLQSYLSRNPTIKIYVNTNEMIDAIRVRAEREPNRLFRVGTGEVIDSLVYDELTDLSLSLVPFFGSRENLLLELKTKSNTVRNLLTIPESVHQRRTVVSWSVNAKTVTEKDEAKTASLEERIAAAAEVVGAGYRVGFHFDPLVHFPGWEDEYRDTVQRIFREIDPKAVAWVSLSSLRYQPEMQEMMTRRFPNSRLPFGEQFLANDQKLRYVQPIRFQMLSFLKSVLKAESPELPVYMCMESAAAWRHIAGGPPVAGTELREVFSRRGFLNILPDDHRVPGK